MAGVVELAQIRLLRPLLAVPPERLRATLLGRGIDWIEDPSNRDPRFARSRLRGAHAALDRLGLTVPRLAAAAGHAGRARAALEASLDQLLAAAVGLDPAGVALIDPDTFLAAPRELRLRLLSAVLTAIGGRVHPPRFEQLERLEAALCGDPAGPGRTLLGCRMIRQRGRWLVFREARGVAAPLDLPAGRPVCWDGRFLATATGGEGQRIGAFALADEAEREAIAGWRPAPHLPRIAWPSLPGLWQDDRLVSVPHLGWSIGGPPIQVTLRFRQMRTVSGAGFVAGSGRGAIGD
jgi:tRNA(Ile)-lysidine synthase